jgi:hypothetical protein
VNIYKRSNLFGEPMKSNPKPEKSVMALTTHADEIVFNHDAQVHNYATLRYTMLGCVILCCTTALVSLIFR